MRQRILTAALCLALLLSACAAPSVRLTNTELAEQREIYPMLYDISDYAYFARHIEGLLLAINGCLIDRNYAFAFAEMEYIEELDRDSLSPELAERQIPRESRYFKFKVTDMVLGHIPKRCIDSYSCIVVYVTRDYDSGFPRFSTGDKYLMSLYFSTPIV